jgi:hypothetical protein
MITAFYKRFRLFSSFQRPRASFSAGREGPTAIVIGRSLVANLHAQTKLEINTNEVIRELRTAHKD